MSVAKKRRTRSVDQGLADRVEPRGELLQRELRVVEWALHGVRDELAAGDRADRGEPLRGRGEGIGQCPQFALDGENPLRQPERGVLAALAQHVPERPRGALALAL